MIVPLGFGLPGVMRVLRSAPVPRVAPSTAHRPAKYFQIRAVRGVDESGRDPMCRNIKTLFNFDPPATHEEIREASVQFVRKISGFSKPSKTNEEAFNRAVDEVAAAAWNLLDSLVTDARPRNREVESARARARAVERFGTS